MQALSSQPAFFMQLAFYSFMDFGSISSTKHFISNDYRDYPMLSSAQETANGWPRGQTDDIPGVEMEDCFS